ncbi:hypothetical protein [Pseudomonas oryzihabitans]|uniref:hypothetical protein n=1 Tax=Pseudomonas oryzihabitans TaxID=47885 RepID=UPI0021B614AE|nr:hypothetical protein [Pseudomonas oryzihabitans]
MRVDYFSCFSVAASPVSRGCRGIAGFLGGLVLAGCAVQPVAEPEPRVVRVEVPVPVPCRVRAPAVPAWAAEGLRKEDSLEVKVRALLAERRQRIGYERELNAVVAACW